MRRCKYYFKEAFCYVEYPNGTNKIGLESICCFPYTSETRCEFMNCLFNESCVNYTPVEIDPYWKDIVDETNRRLNNAR